MRCVVCNWTPHDVTDHVHECPTCGGQGVVPSRLCRNGHPLDIVGVYVRGQRTPRCRACQREANRRYTTSRRQRC